MEWPKITLVAPVLNSAKDGATTEGNTAEAHVGKEVGGPTRVNEALLQVGADMTRVRIVPAWFQDTFPSRSASQIALLNIDIDWHESVKLCLNTFSDLVVPGGPISIDDYGHWAGCRKAADEFSSARRLMYQLRRVDYNAFWFRKD